MNYIGSKLKLSTWIKEEVEKTVSSDLSDKVFCDIFAGTGIVGRTFKPHVKKIISNDIEHYSFVLNKNYISNSTCMQDAQDYLDELNATPECVDGFIYKNYCLGSGSGRQYFSDANGKKIDAVRQKIKELKEREKIDDDMYYFLLTSLLESADKVANTASVYGTFLKHLKKPAQKELLIKAADFDERLSCDLNQHEIHKEDSNTLIKKIKGDILYLDPPYNQRQYGANYHILNTIALYDDFIPKGKTGVRKYSHSSYCKKRHVIQTFEDLIKNAEFNYIFLSYNNEGLMSKDEIQNIMSKYGKYDLRTKEHQKFKAYKTAPKEPKANSTFEYLHILQKDKF